MKDYRYALRNFNISDDEYINLVDDVLNDIAYDTRCFRKLVPVDIYEAKKKYNLVDILTGYEKDTMYNLINPDIGEDTKDYSKTAIMLEANYIDKILLRNGDIYEPANVSVPNVTLNDLLVQIGETDYELRISLDDRVYRFYFEISYIPNIQQIFDKREVLIQNALIAGLLYKASVLYSSRFDVNMISYYEKIYELEKRKVINKITNFYSDKGAMIWE